MYMQEELMADCATASAHIAAWLNRSGKRSAGENPSQAVATLIPVGDVDSHLLAQGAVGAELQLKVYLSPGAIPAASRARTRA